MKDDTEAKPAFTARTPLWRWPAVVVTCLATMVVAGTLGVRSAQSVSAVAAGPALLSQAADLGPMSATSPIELTVWLKMRDSAGLDRAAGRSRAAQGTDSTSLSEEQIDQRHAPSAADVTAVTDFLKARGLRVTDTGPHNLLVKATGTVAAVDAAFQVKLHRYSLHGDTFHAAAAPPKLPADIAERVVRVGGLTELRAQPTILPSRWDRKVRHGVRHVNELAGKPLQMLPLSAVASGSASSAGITITGPNGILITSQCFYPPTTASFSNGTATASFSGTVLGNTAPSGVAELQLPCIYAPNDLQTAYNLTPLYKAGLDGTGQTIAIVDHYGSITIQQDLAAFSQLFGLPPANLQIIGTPTGSVLSSDSNISGWATETSLDVEWAHAIAPGAKIILVIAPGDVADGLIEGDLTAAQQPGVVTISNSWVLLESQTDVPFRATTDGILKLAAAKGISVNFASGDYGNYAIKIYSADVSYPASSPYATSIGGVSVALDSSQHILFQTAWGESLMALAVPAADGSSQLEDPPEPVGFVKGGGGGVSSVYPLPPWQKSLTRWGNRRLQPDISWVADPLTPVAIVFTGDAQGDLFLAGVGGTSAATPMFSGLWAVAAQKAGKPLGQAAPRLYSLPPQAFYDVLAPQDSSANVTGTLTDANGAQQLTAEDLVMPLQGQRTFLSALYNGDSSDWVAVTFGLDSTLPAGPGWDPATGLGTPNGVAFVNAVAP